MKKRTKTERNFLAAYRDYADCLGMRSIDLETERTIERNKATCKTQFFLMAMLLAARMRKEDLQ